MGAQLLQVPDRLVGDVVGEVVALGVLVDVHRRVVPDQVVGLVEVRPPLEHAVVALEPALQRPRVTRRATVHGAVAGQVPLADREGRVAGGAQRLGERLDRRVDLHRPPGEAGVEVRDPGEPRPVRVHPGLDRRPGRRAQRRGVVVREPDAVGGEPVDRRRRDLGSVGPDVAEAHVVEQDEHDVGAPRRGADRGRPPRRRLPHGATDRTTEPPVTVRHPRASPGARTARRRRRRSPDGTALAAPSARRPVTSAGSGRSRSRPRCCGRAGRRHGGRCGSPGR